MSNLRKCRLHSWPMTQTPRQKGRLMGTRLSLTESDKKFLSTNVPSKQSAIRSTVGSIRPAHSCARPECGRPGVYPMTFARRILYHVTFLHHSWLTTSPDWASVTLSPEISTVGHGVTDMYESQSAAFSPQAKFVHKYFKLSIET